MTIPNALTAIRILLIPPFLLYYLSNQISLAVILFAAAAATDIFDGTLARLLRQRTPLGAILDPAADKLLGLTSLAALVSHSRLPGWLLVLSLLRDAVVLVAAGFSKARSLPISIAPSRIGKYATFFANLAVVLALADEISYAPWLAEYVDAVALVAAECLAVAALQYGWRLARALSRVGQTPSARER